MTKMFGNLTATEELAETKDTLGGGFEPIPSDVYDAKIKLAYVGKSQRSNAQSVNIHYDVNGQELRETIWVTNGKGENFYISKDDNKTRVPLPGFTTVNDICLLVTNAELMEQDTETKVVKLYSPAEKKEVPTEVPVLTALIGGEVKLGILRSIVDKNEKGDDGNYHPTGETRTINEINKVFHPETCRTVNEYLHEIEEPEFYTAWLERNKGKDRPKAKGAQGGGGAGQSGSGRPGAAAGGGAAKSPGKKLFG